jgi:hypothetical protein
MQNHLIHCSFDRYLDCFQTFAIGTGLLKFLGVPVDGRVQEFLRGLFLGEIYLVIRYLNVEINMSLPCCFPKG